MRLDRRNDLPGGALVLQVVGAGVERGVHERFLGGLLLGDRDDALLLEHPGHAVGLAQVPAPLGEHVAQLADRPVAVVGERLDDDRGAAGAVPLVGHLFVGHALFFAGAAPDGPLDVVGGHVVRLGLGDDRAQPRVHVGVAAAVSGGNGQFLDDAGEDLAALGVSRALLVLDGVPLGMAGHCALSFAKNGPKQTGNSSIRLRRVATGAARPRSLRFPDFQTQGGLSALSGRRARATGTASA